MKRAPIGDKEPVLGRVDSGHPLKTAIKTLNKETDKSIIVLWVGSFNGTWPPIHCLTKSNNFKHNHISALLITYLSFSVHRKNMKKI